MPTILKKKGYRLFFYSNELQEPPHIHVEYQSCVAKFWLQPVRLARNIGMNISQLRTAEELVKENENFILEKWYEYFSKRDNI